MAIATRRWRSALTWLLVVGAVAGWFVYLRPVGLGGSASYVIVSGASMEPMMHTGDLAIVRAKPAYGIGDVVAYRIPESDVGGGMLVIHRVIGGTLDDGLILQGDNRETPDMWRPRSEDVAGSLLAHVPHVGTALFLLRTPLVLATAAGLLGFWFIVLRGSGDSDDDEAADDIVVDDLDVQVPLPAPVPRPVPVSGPTAPAAPASYRTLIAPAVLGVVIGVALGGSNRR